MILSAAQRIGQAVVCNINQKIKIGTTDRLQNNSLGFSGTKTRNLRLQKIGITLIACKCKTFLVLTFTDGTPFYKIMIHFFSKGFASLQRNDSQ